MTHHPKFNPARRWLWLGSLSIASAIFSLALACAMPFAALAALAATSLSRRDGLLVMAAAWAANQVVGFMLLDYPATPDSIAWGLALLAAAGLAMIAADRIDARARQAAWRGWQRVPSTFLAGFAAYEGALFAATFLLPGEAAFTWPVIAEIFAVNAVALTGLLPVQDVAERFGLYPHPWKAAAAPVAAA